MVKVATALRRELRELSPPVRGSALAGSALALATMLDDPGTADTARTAAARELRETLEVLRERAASTPAVDRLDQLAEARGTRKVASR